MHSLEQHVGADTGNANKGKRMSVTDKSGETKIQFDKDKCSDQCHIGSNKKTFMNVCSSPSIGDGFSTDLEIS